MFEERKVGEVKGVCINTEEAYQLRESAAYLARDDPDDVVADKAREIYQNRIEKLRDTEEFAIWEEMGHKLADESSEFNLEDYERICGYVSGSSEIHTLEELGRDKIFDQGAIKYLMEEGIDVTNVDRDDLYAAAQLE